MNQSDILTAIYTKLSSTANLPQKIYQNVKAPATMESEYLEIFVMPLPIENQAFGGVENKSGLIQINVVVALEKGTIRPAQIADLILAAFKQGTVISSGLKVSRPSYVSAGIMSNQAVGINADNRYILPVTIRYQNLSS